MRKWIIVLMALAWAFSCQENPTKDNTEKELQVDESVAEQAALGYQVNQYVATGDEIEMMTSGFDNPDINSGFGVMNSQTQSSNHAIARFNRIKGYIKDVQTLQKVQGEVPLFYEDSVNENGDKYRSAALVDAVNGTMRFYYVIYEFASRNVNGRNVTLNMTYDSTEIKFTFSGQNFENLEPQQIFAIQLFKPDYLVQSTTTVMDITSFTNDEVQSFASKTTSVYNSSRLDSTVALLNFQIDGTSTVTQTFYFDDGTSRTSTITFNIDGTGSFSRTLRSGVTVRVLSIR
ncbi:MAG: hypothetical protein D6677_12310 [Calditrichaeota bacterium]|nr:MAG: hypothetical protein D6677_12310 [Calditrichota bacterium]